jgi:hypothetical protein
MDNFDHYAFSPVWSITPAKRQGKINIMKRKGRSRRETRTSDSNKPTSAESPQINHCKPGNTEFIKQLKQRLEETRLPANLKEHIVGNLPPPDEQERLYREIQQNGGLSSEQFFTSLRLESEQTP